MTFIDHDQPVRAGPVGDVLVTGHISTDPAALDVALINVSYFYNRDVKESVERVQQLIEPLLTVILGLLLGWIMLSVLGPVYDVISKIKT